MSNKKVLVGTTKGLVIIGKVAKKWQVIATHFLGLPVSVIYINELNNTWWAGISHHHWGQKLHYSTDEGSTWTSAAVPAYPVDAQIANGKAATFKKIWVLQHGGPQFPNRIWMGTEPGGLFVSEDDGQHFKIVDSLWNHPSRMNQQQWFGTGRSQPFIHSIVVHPEDNAHLYIAVSCAGIFESFDSGQSWQPRNQGLIAAYLPNPNVEVGHDPHRLLVCETQPEVLWQQNHCGIFRSTDGAKTWTDVSDPSGMPNYGFALAVNRTNPEQAWVIPAVSDELRVAPNQALVVCRTDDGGQTWHLLRSGLPQRNCFDIVFRHAFANSDELFVFGTTTGNLFLSENSGEHWQNVSHHLARVDCVAIQES
ncbi:MAG: glycosyl hydrolase [Bacteroidota bacterium]